ncbi:hypothetical protein YC2023_016348 [Brassica napus]
MDVMEVRENLHNQIGALDCLIRFKKSLFLKWCKYLSNQYVNIPYLVMLFSSVNRDAWLFQKLEEIEEGEVVKGWLNATPGKTSKSPKTKSLEYGQSIMTTNAKILLKIFFMNHQVLRLRIISE